jgi:hypothetical protein
MNTIEDDEEGGGEEEKRRRGEGNKVLLDFYTLYLFPVAQ